jgi:hypothetical protein
MDANVCPPETGTGVSLLVVVPSPSCPALFLPQQKAIPATVRPQVWSPPALMELSAMPGVVFNSGPCTGSSRGAIGLSASWQPEIASRVKTMSNRRGLDLVQDEGEGSRFIVSSDCGRAERVAPPHWRADGGSWSPLFR